MPPADPDQRYAAIVKALSRNPGVTHEAAGRIFAMLVRGSLVVKLPRGRVDALVDVGQGKRFDPRRNGRLMKEWLVVTPASPADWQSLAEEALRFVGT